jgi:hypothetical protein
MVRVVVAEDQPVKIAKKEFCREDNWISSRLDVCSGRIVTYERH